MKVTVKGYLTFRKSIGQRLLELDDSGRTTLREVLTRVTLECELGNSLYSTTSSAVDRGAVVLVNGRHHTHLPDRLETVIVDGDEVAIFPPLAGG